MELLTGFAAHRLLTEGEQVTVVARDSSGAEQKITVDRIVAATGFRPDHAITAELRMDLDPILGCRGAVSGRIILGAGCLWDRIRGVVSEGKSVGGE